MLEENGHNLRVEDQLLLGIARTQLDASQADRIRTLVQSVNWTYLIEAAHRHRLTALLYWHLNRVCRAEIPTATWSDLRIAFFRAVAGNFFRTTRLLRICECFRARDILLIPYKGPVLGALAYRDLPVREFDDLDLLVRSDDIPRAYEALAAEGYHPAFPLPSGPAQQTPGQYLFEADNGTLVELHTERTLRYFPVSLDLDRLSRRLQPVPLLQGAIPTLTTEDVLPLLCVHGCKHFWQRLAWICDIAELARGSLQWKQVEEEAKRLRCERMLLLGLCLANGLLDAPVPDDLLARARASSAVRGLAAQVRGRLFELHYPEPGLIERFFFRVRMRGGLWEGVKYSLRLATAPTEEDWGRAPLPVSLWAALRPVFLLRKYGLGLRRPVESEPSGRSHRAATGAARGAASSGQFG